MMKIRQEQTALIAVNRSQRGLLEKDTSSVLFRLNIQLHVQLYNDIEYLFSNKLVTIKRQLEPSFFNTEYVE